MQKWEYKTISSSAGNWAGLKGSWKPQKFDELLNELGRDGWELISIYQDRAHRGTTQSLSATFKRPIGSE